MVFQPGGVAAGNVYTTWAALYAALDAAAPASANGFRSPTVVQIDDSFVTPAVIPAGAYNLDSVSFTCVASFLTSEGGAALQIGAGVTITCGQLSFADGLSILYDSATPCISVSGASQECNVYLTNVDLECTSAGGVFIEVTAGFGFLRQSIQGIIGDGVDPVGTSSGAGALEIVSSGSCIVRANALTGANSTLTYNTQTPGAQGVGVTVSQDIGYTAGTPANWAPPAPTQMNEALDRLAAAVEGILGHAIP